MKKNAMDQSSKRLRRAAMAVVASGVMAAATAHGNPSDNFVLIPPTDLPALARQTGEAMFLHDAIDGRSILYIKQDQGARPAVFDVNDPVHIKGEGAVLNLPRVKDPQLKTVQGLTLPGDISRLGNDRLGNDGFTVTGEASRVLPVRDYQIVDAVNLRELDHVFDVKQVRAETTKADTGAAFMLEENGSYVIRRPAVESIHQMMIISPD